MQRTVASTVLLRLCRVWRKLALHFYHLYLIISNHSTLLLIVLLRKSASSPFMDLKGPAVEKYVVKTSLSVITTSVSIERQMWLAHHTHTTINNILHYTIIIIILSFFFKVWKRIKNFSLWFIMGFMFSCNVWNAFLGLPEKAWKLTKYVLPRATKLEKRTFNDDLVVISKEFKRLYINVNPSRWKNFNYRNIHSWRYSIIGKHSPVHTGTAGFECSIRNCYSLSDYIMIANPFHVTRPFIRIEILIFQGQERQVFLSNLTISNYNFEFVPRPLFVADARKYEDACRHIEKKKAAENIPSLQL